MLFNFPDDWRLARAQVWTNFNELVDGLRLREQVIREFVDASSGAVTVMLPSVSNARGVYFFAKQDSSGNAVTVQAAGTDTIEGSTTTTLSAQYDNVTLVPKGGVWYIQ